MGIRNTASHWGAISIVLHWGIVLLLLATALIGLFMDELPSSAGKVRVFALHKSLGLTILGLMALRLLWRLASGRPAAVPGIARWQSAVAGLTHWMLYAALFAMPLSGWLYNSASNFPLRWFGLFRVPAISGRDGDLKDFAHDAHETLFWVIVVLVAMHAGAALWHHVVRRDATLDRMLPRPLRRAVPAATRDAVR